MGKHRCTQMDVHIGWSCTSRSTGATAEVAASLKSAKYGHLLQYYLTQLRWEPWVFTWTHPPLPSSPIWDATFLQSLVMIGRQSSPILDCERRARSWSRFLGSQPPCDISHQPGGRLPLLARGYFPPPKRSPSLIGTKLYCLVTEAHRGVSSLSKVTIMLGRHLFILVHLDHNRAIQLCALSCFIFSDEPL